MTEFRSIRDILEHPAEGAIVKVRGWVHRIRKTGKLIFAVIRNESGIIQVTLFRDGGMDREQFRLAKASLVESSVIVEGILARDDRAPGGYEVQVTSFEVVGPAEKFPITKDQSDEFLLDNRHLWLRSRRMTAILKIRSTIFDEIRNYFQDRGFYEVQSPVFQSGACEGGSTLFEVPYFDVKDKVYLTQSWQLYAEAMMFGLENIYTISPAFRAEKSRTRRHLTEFWMAEVEGAWQGNADMMKHSEGLVMHLVERCIERNRSELAFLERDIGILENIELPFPRYRYAEILDMLGEKGMELPWGADLGYTEEKTLTEDLRSPIFITHFPRTKGFYHRVDPDDLEGKTVLCHDLLAPEGYGEIIGGGEREWKLNILLERMKEFGMEPGQYDWYLDLRRYGSVPHSGFGLGIGRTVAWITGEEHIKNCIPFPRMMRRYTP